MSAFVMLLAFSGDFFSHIFILAFYSLYYEYYVY